MAYFRLGLVGAGRMGRTHLRALAESESVRVTAIAEPSVQQRQDLSGTATTVHATADAMLEAGNIDGVLIAAPTNLHLGLVQQVLAQGRPVLCEKPCGATPEEAREAAQLAAEARLPLQVAYWRRFVPALRRLRDRIAAGEFGQIYLVTCYQWDAEPPALAFRGTSGGIFVDMGVHEFDQLRWLTNQELSELHSMHSDAWSGPPVAGHAESAQVLCQLSGGANGFVSLGQRFPAGDVCWAQAFGTRNAEECRFLWPPDAESAFLHALRAQAESFARYARGGPREGAEAADAVAALIAAQSASRIFSSRPEIP
jgi:myo-inositol 2-dehydrogenase / D-chiro-inositol 1-dehydrogenase